MSSLLCWLHTCLLIVALTKASASADLNFPGPLVGLSNCRQSSVALGSICQSAISNRLPTGGFTNPKACSQTRHGDSEWWQAQLTSNSAARVTFVQVHQLKGCCKNASKPLLTVTLDGNDCPLRILKLQQRSRQVFFCNRTGQTVRVTSELPNTQLTVCQVQVFAENLADIDADHPLLQLSNCSQLPPSSSATCQKATDGRTRTGCIAVPENGWWEAQTQKASLIKYVRIYSAMTCCQDSAYKFSVSVDGSNCISYSGAYFSARDFLCKRKGRNIRIVNRMQTGQLLLCEVQAFGSRRTPVDYGVPIHLSSCSQSSSVNGSRCRKALDGSVAQVCARCARTRVERGWWQGRTSQRVLVKFVRIFLPNAGSGCGPNDLERALVTVSGTECTPFESGRSVYILFCNATGQGVTIRNLHASELTICEVQAMGAYLEPEHPEHHHKRIRKGRGHHHRKVFSPHWPNPHRPHRRPILVRCSQSSSVPGSHCRLATDGSRKRCAKTAAERGAWWQAGLHHPRGTKSHRVGAVVLALEQTLSQKVLQSAKALKRLRVTVNNQPCRMHSTHHRGSGAEFECNKIGDLIRVSNGPDGSMAPLVLCEVLVLAWPIQ